MITFLTGSRAFFDGKISDFKPYDTDWLIFFDSDEELNNTKFCKENGNDYFKYNKNNYINFLYNNLKNGVFVPMYIGGLLIPDICNYLNISLNDLKQFEEFMPNIDNKHLYLVSIYNAYKKNNEMLLTDKQLKTAYNLYKKYR